MLKRYIQRMVKRGQLGQSIVVLALGMIALLGFVGITTDVSILFVRYSTLRRAVDSAAIAAAGQMREDRSIATVSLTARQFIEFHGLSPRDVWVETCHNQPRIDRDPLEPGLQHEPRTVIDARNAMEAAEQTVADSVAAGDPQSTIISYQQAADGARQTYLSELRTFFGETGSTDLQNQRAVYESARTAWLNDPVDAGAYDTYNSRFISYRQQLENEALDQQFDDDEICTGDQRKLVRVTAQIESPTVFLRLFGWQNITLEASAISETAVMDVVIVMDVSESMLTETTYNDWAEINLGTAYIPPYIANTVTGNWADLGDTDTVLGRMANDGWLPPRDPDVTNPLIDWRMRDQVGTEPFELTLWGETEPFSSGTWYPDWFWQEHILGRWQADVNDRLHFLEPSEPIDGNPLIDSDSDPATRGPTDDPLTNNPASDGVAAINPEDPSNLYYQVRSFVPSAVVADYGATQGHPRPACRVRFYPYSTSLNLTTTWPAYRDGSVETIAELYDQDGGLNNGNWPNIENWSDSNTENDPKWGGFVPTYNFYGCCNDPTVDTFVDEEGNYVDSGGTALGTRIPQSGYSADAVGGDFNFSDLVCQPFKQARDATRQFLERIDFLRGDRVAFVTFDRTAFLIDPDGEGNATTHMIETLETAQDTLNRFVGVRAEPSYYEWDTANGGWVGFSAGFDPETGSYTPLDYSYDPTDGSTPGSFTDTVNPAAVNYPAYSNCFIQNAELPYPFSLYSTRNEPPGADLATFNRGPAAMDRLVQPDFDNIQWRNVESALNTEFDLLTSYEKHAMCRGTNVGAALREANNALTDPTTSRREGTVWVIIFLGDGAAGASDPVRRFGGKLNQLEPYELVERFDWQERDPGVFDPPSRGIYGSDPAGYGAYGVCPYGDINTPSRLGELMTGNKFAFPWCSDSDPFTRHFCLDDGRAVGMANKADIIANNDLNSFGPGFQPNSADRDYRNAIAPDQATYDAEVAAAEAAGRVPDLLPPMPADYPGGETAYIQDVNVQLGNIFEIDIADINDPNNPCDPLYDVEDYARDWADFIAGVDEESGDDAVLPTIFTIGFGLNFERGDGSCEENVEDCLGEELLRYIADAGDNFRIDNDIQQDLRDNAIDWLNFKFNRYPTLDGSVESTVEGWGPKDPCESEDLLWRGPFEADGTPITDDLTIRNMLQTRTPGESCGNYYNAPNAAELELVFDDIASRMFTRLAG